MPAPAAEIDVWVAVNVGKEFHHRAGLVDQRVADVDLEDPTGSSKRSTACNRSTPARTASSNGGLLPGIAGSAPHVEAVHTFLRYLPKIREVIYSSNLKQ